MQFGFGMHSRLSREYKFSWGWDMLVVVDLRYQNIWRAHSIIKSNWIVKTLFKRSLNIL